MSRTHRDTSHSRWFTPRRTRNRLFATSREVITEHAQYGNRIPGVDDASYDDILDDARTAQQAGLEQ